MIKRIRNMMGEEAYNLLLRSGLEWRIDQGGSHKKLVLEGRLIGILPNSLKPGGTNATTLNFKAQVKRAIRDLGGNL